LTTLNLHANLLDDTFAVYLSQLLGQNPVLHEVDISKNPIGPQGAKKLLDAVLEQNQTLSSLGDLSENDMMGVRTREELRQALMLNNSSHDKKKAFLEMKQA
jgi:Ran GTPase-activating protein (RanGAP) involved in mRNA processing and transport